MTFVASMNGRKTNSTDSRISHSSRSISRLQNLLRERCEKRQVFASYTDLSSRFRGKSSSYFSAKSRVMICLWVKTELISRCVELQRDLQSIANARFTLFSIFRRWMKAERMLDLLINLTNRRHLSRAFAITVWSWHVIAVSVSTTSTAQLSVNISASAASGSSELRSSYSSFSGSESCVSSLFWSSSSSEDSMETSSRIIRWNRMRPMWQGSLRKVVRIQLTWWFVERANHYFRLFVFIIANRRVGSIAVSPRCWRTLDPKA